MSESTNPLQVQSFDHITLIVDDLHTTRKFYVEILGMKECSRPAFDFPGAWFEVDGVQIHATVAGELAGLAGWGERNVKSISRGHHFAFAVADMNAAVQAIEAQGIPIADGPKRRPDGFDQIYIYDPDGHLVELFSSPTK